MWPFSPMMCAFPRAAFCCCSTFFTANVCEMLRNSHLFLAVVHLLVRYFVCLLFVWLKSYKIFGYMYFISKPSMAGVWSYTFNSLNLAWFGVDRRFIAYGKSHFRGTNNKKEVESWIAVALVQASSQHLLHCLFFRAFSWWFSVCALSRSIWLFTTDAIYSSCVPHFFLSRLLLAHAQKPLTAIHSGRTTTHITQHIQRIFFYLFNTDFVCLRLAFILYARHVRYKLAVVLLHTPTLTTETI